MVEKGMFYVLFSTFLHFNRNLMPFLEQPINFLLTLQKKIRAHGNLKAVFHCARLQFLHIRVK